MLQEFLISVSHCRIPSRLPQIGIFDLGSGDSNSDLQLNQYMIYLMSLHQPLSPSCQGPYHLTAILLRTKPRTQEHLDHSKSWQLPQQPSLGHAHPVSTSASPSTSAYLCSVLPSAHWFCVVLFVPLPHLSLTNQQTGRELAITSMQGKQTLFLV